MSDIGSCLGAALHTWQCSCFTELKQSVPLGANRLPVCLHYQGRHVRGGCGWMQPGRTLDKAAGRVLRQDRVG
jgi:hypothetical protein